jgi:uncharacterized membrane protein YagU involved in acid resistance
MFDAFAFRGLQASFVSYVLCLFFSAVCSVLCCDVVYTVFVVKLNKVLLLCVMSDATPHFALCTAMNRRHGLPNHQYVSNPLLLATVALVHISHSS